MSLGRGPQPQQPERQLGAFHHAPAASERGGETGSGRAPSSCRLPRVAEVLETYWLVGPQYSHDLVSRCRTGP